MLSDITVTSDFIAIIAGALLSLLFSYFPKLNTWYASLEEGTKKLIMLGALFLTVSGLFAAGCAGLININGFACDKATAINYVKMLMLAVIANQSVFKITPVTSAVTEAKA